MSADRVVAVAIMVGMVLSIVGIEMRRSYYRSTAFKGALATLIGVLLVGGGLYSAVHLQLG